MLRNLNQCSTNTLHSIKQQIENELERRNNGEIPKHLRCDVCSKEFEGDRYQFDESSFACNLCYENNEEIQGYHDQWAIDRTNELTKELYEQSRLKNYYFNTNSEKYNKYQDRCDEIENELEKLGI